VPQPRITGFRQLIGLATMAMAFAGSTSAANAPDERTLAIYNIHTKETIAAIYKRDGRYVPEGLERLNWAMRDWRENEPTEMDTELLDLLWEIHHELGSREPIHLISGYRSSKTNEKLRRTRGGQARKSQHILGRAADVHFPDVPVKQLRYSGLIRQQGGVGYYPTSAIPFVHIDTGRVRHWPRMGRNELALLFPDGRTKHRPSAGGPIRRTDVANARRRVPELAQKIAAFHDFRAAPKDGSPIMPATQFADAGGVATTLAGIPSPQLAGRGSAQPGSAQPGAGPDADVGTWRTNVAAVEVPRPSLVAQRSGNNSVATDDTGQIASRPSNDGVLAALELPLQPVPGVGAVSASTGAAELTLASAETAAPSAGWDTIVSEPRQVATEAVVTPNASVAGGSAQATAAADAGAIEDDLWGAAARIASQLALFFMSEDDADASPVKAQERMSLGLADIAPADIDSEVDLPAVTSADPSLNIPRAELRAQTRAVVAVEPVADPATKPVALVQPAQEQPGAGQLELPIVGDGKSGGLVEIPSPVNATPVVVRPTKPAALSADGWVASPDWDADHPSELSYRPFPVAPLITANPDIDDPVFTRLIHPDVVSARRLIGEDAIAAPLRFEAGVQYAELLWADLFKDREPSNILAAGYAVTELTDGRIRSRQN